MAIYEATLQEYYGNIYGSAPVDGYYLDPPWFDDLEASDPLTGSSVLGFADLDNVMVAASLIEDDWYHVVYYDATDSSTVTWIVYNTTTREVYCGYYFSTHYYYLTAAVIASAFASEGVHSFWDAVGFPTRIPRRVGATLSSVVSGGSVTYTQSPEWFDILAANGSLAAYDFPDAEYCTDVYLAATDLGLTGWRRVVYCEADGGRYFFTFIYNNSTREVVTITKTGSYTVNASHGQTLGYWNYPYTSSILEAFSEGGATNFFSVIGKTRSTYLISSEDNTTAISWTSYHDALAAELAALLSQYGWQDSADITARVATIRNELAAVSGALNSNTRQTELTDLLADFEQAKDDADATNEERYTQLIDGAVDGNQDPTEPMSYPQIAKHMLDEYFTTLVDDHGDLQTDQETRDELVADAHGSVWTSLDARITTVSAMKTDQAARDDEIIELYDEALESLDTRIEDVAVLQDNQITRDGAVVNSFEQVWTDVDSRITTVSSVQADQAARDAEVATSYATIWQELEELFDDLGEQAKADVEDTFRTRRAELVQSMSERGIYGTSIAASFEVNLASAEAAEVKRIDEAINAAKIQAYQPVLMTQASVKQQGSQNQMSIEMALAGMQVEAMKQILLTAAGDERQGAQNALGIEQMLAVAKLDALRTMLLSSLQEQRQGAQNQMTIEQFLAALQVDGMRTTLLAEAGDKRQGAQNVMQLGLATLQWKSSVAAMMSQLYQLAPGVIERRTDLAPTLADIANIVINAGRGQGTQQLLGQFAPSQFIQQPGGGMEFNLGQFLQKAITQ